MDTVNHHEGLGLLNTCLIFTARFRFVPRTVQGRVPAGPVMLLLATGLPVDGHDGVCQSPIGNNDGAGDVEEQSECETNKLCQMNYQPLSGSQ